MIYLSKLKQLLPKFQDKVEITCPVSDDEILDRQLQYPLLAPMKFAKRYHNHLYEPVSFSLNSHQYKIQYNHCANPFCESFGLQQERFEKVKHKPYRYKLQGAKNRRAKYIVCNDLPIVTKFRRQRMDNDELLDQLIAYTVWIAKEMGVLNSRTLIVDSTHSRARYGQKPIKQGVIEEAKRLRQACY